MARAMCGKVASDELPISAGRGIGEGIAMPLRPLPASLVSRCALSAGLAGLGLVTACENVTIARASGRLAVAPARLVFEPTDVGLESVRSLSFANVGEGRIEVRALTKVPPFVLLEETPFPLAPGEERTVRVAFRPATPGRFTGEMTFQHDGQGPNGVVALSGRTEAEAAAQGLCVTPTALDFRDVKEAATQTIEVSACAGVPVVVTAITPPDDAEFSVPALDGPRTVDPGVPWTIPVEYRPTDDEADLSELILQAEGIDPVAVRLSGSRYLVPETGGRFLYFWQVAPESRQSDIARLGLQGGARETYFGQRAEPPSEGCPGCHQVSPDGRYVAMVESLGSRWRLSVIDTENRQRLDVPPEVSEAVSMSWRPNVGAGRGYEYVAAVAGRLHRASLEGGYLGPLTDVPDPEVRDQFPTWGPDDRIAFARGQRDPKFGAVAHTGPTDLLLVSADGGAPTPLLGASRNQMANYYPAFSPDGEWIAFTQSRGEGSNYLAPDAQLRLVRTDGSGTVRLLSTVNGDNGQSSFPAWSLDGRYLSFSSNRAGGRGDWDLYIAPIDPMSGRPTGGAIHLGDANSPEFEHGAQWSP